MSLNVLAKALDNLLRSDVSDDMYLVYSEPCPYCNGEMLVGDYVCWGICFKCFDSEMQKSLLETAK